MMASDEKIVQITARAEGDTTLQALFALTDKGNIFKLDSEYGWHRIELPKEQQDRYEMEKATKAKKKGWFG